MKYLLVYAHPEPSSLNGSIKDFILQELQHQGHQVLVSDLYAMNWQATLQATDCLGKDVEEPFDIARDTLKAFQNATQSPDIQAEQEKLMWADAVLFQFPLWWFSMPAILKGWFDRVYTNGFAYGVGEHNDSHWGDRYGEGVFAGKRAMLLVSAGGWEEHYSERGVNGAMSDLLFPITHGTLFYAGFEVLPSFIIYKTHKVNAERFTKIKAELAERLQNIFIDQAIPYRPQNAGDYEIPGLILKKDKAADQTGLAIHQLNPVRRQ